MIPKRDDILSGGIQIHGGSFGGGRYYPRSDDKTIKEMIEDYSVDKILDNIDIEEIELYLRKKKLDKIIKK